MHKMEKGEGNDTAVKELNGLDNPHYMISRDTELSNAGYGMEGDWKAEFIGTKAITFSLQMIQS